MSQERVLRPTELQGTIVRESGDGPIDGDRYRAENGGDSLIYKFEAGELADCEFLTFDLFLEGTHLTTWELQLRETDTDRTFTMSYRALNQCEARARIPRAATDQVRWKWDREAAWLKPLAGGDRVSLSLVDELRIVVRQKSDEPVEWWQSPVIATPDEPEQIEHPTLPNGTLLDPLGQSNIHEWDRRTASEEELTDRLTQQLQNAETAQYPSNYSDWGGWEHQSFEATGFFRTKHDGDRWWLIDPDGHPFWSTGLDLVRPYIDAVYSGLEDAFDWLPDPDGEYSEAFLTSRTHGEGELLEMVNHVAINFRRVFGDDWYDAWTEIVLGQLEDWGFNTVANWSDWEIAAEAGVPYVRPLTLRFEGVEMIYRDFPDVYHPDFHQAAKTFAEQLEDTVGDPAMIGYFMGNEPHWSFADEPPAAGMLFTTESCETRREFAAFLHRRYGSDDELSRAWNIDVTLRDISHGEWEEILPEEAEDDIEDFSAIMVDRFYRVLSEACSEVDPDHLNLGTRYPGMPREWEMSGMRHVDVFSVNCYQERVDERYASVTEQLNIPVMIGEWHFGALDVGLPAPGLMHVSDQAARGDAYRVYLEDAATRPWCIGAHYFTLYDESALGRFDGENWNIGFVDVCNLPYEELCTAARRSHERMYDVAAGNEEPFDEPPEYLPRLA